METERYRKAYDSLVEAYFKGELKSGFCGCCAVGNICKSAGVSDPTEWGYLFVTSNGKQHFSLNKAFIHEHNTEIYYTRIKSELLEKTKYTWEELAKIEFAFETNIKGDWFRRINFSEQEVLEDQYNGLCAVLKVMQELDNMDIDIKENKFKKHPKLVLN